jgi:methyl-accepting chemotaxis protein
MRLTIKLKLALAFGAVIMLAGVIAVLGISSLASLNATMDSVLRGPVQRAQMEADLHTDLLQIVLAEKNLIAAETPQEVEQFDQEILKLRQVMTSQGDQLYAIGSVEGKRQFDIFRAGWQQFLAMQDKVRELARQNHDAEARALSMGQGRQLIQAPQTQLVNLIQLNQKIMNESVAGAQRSYADSRLLLIGVVAGCLLIGAGTATWISLGISRRLACAVGLAGAVAEGDLGQTIAASGSDEIRSLIDALNGMTSNLRETASIAEAIAGGDLTVEAKRRSDKDVLGTALERMLEKLRGVVSEALSASDNVSSGSQELSATAGQLSQGSTSQASSMQEASSSMEQMAANIKQNADNAAQTERIARQSAKDAETSGTAVGQSVEAMQTIAGKITIVQEIARQTDLLTLYSKRMLRCKALARIVCRTTCKIPIDRLA